MSDTSKDNRAHQRVEARIPVQIVDHSGAEYEGCLLNVSESGAYIESDFSLVKGFCGIISIDGFSAEMTVVRSGDSGQLFGFGMIFESPSEDDMNTLRELVARASG
jgi:hypothetical protein